MNTNTYVGPTPQGMVESGLLVRPSQDVLDSAVSSMAADDILISNTTWDDCGDAAGRQMLINDLVLEVPTLREGAKNEFADPDLYWEGPWVTRMGLDLWVDFRACSTGSIITVFPASER